jgi:excisionase family DNA binding protein
LRRSWRWHRPGYLQWQEAEMAIAADTESAPFTEMRLARSVSIEQAGNLLNVSRRTAYYRIRDGRLQTIRTLGGSQRVLVESLYGLGFQPQAFSTSASARDLPGPIGPSLNPRMARNKNDAVKAAERMTRGAADTLRQRRASAISMRSSGDARHRTA